MIKQCYRDVLKLNQKMLESANKNEWEDLYSLTVQRHKVVEQFFNTESDLSSSREAEELASDIQKTDELLSQKIASAKVKMTQEGLNLQHTQKAIRQYQVDLDNP